MKGMKGLKGLINHLVALPCVPSNKVCIIFIVLHLIFVRKNLLLRKILYLH